jgi:hypothetical protein
LPFLNILLKLHVTKSKLDSEGFKTILMDEKTIISDSLISSAIGGVKLEPI